MSSHTATLTNLLPSSRLRRGQHLPRNKMIFSEVLAHWILPDSLMKPKASALT
ncbi:unnamed protein product [Prunus brigantina]